jgi:hypothetical protein
METTAVFKKTAKGQEAFAHRSPELSAAQRSLLIMVDGKRPVADLARVAAAFGDINTLLQDLIAKGMIEASSSGQAAPLRPATQAPTPTAQPVPLTAGTQAPAASPSVPRSLQDARRFAVRTLTDALGPGAESYCLRIEAAKNPTELLGAAQRAAQVLSEGRGKTAAQQFLTGVELRLPE